MRMMMMISFDCINDELMMSVQVDGDDWERPTIHKGWESVVGVCGCGGGGLGG